MNRKDLHKLLYDHHEWLENRTWEMMSTYHIPKEYYKDLRQEFTLAFLDKYKNYDPNRKARYTTYLYDHLKGVAQRFLYENNFAVRLPRGAVNAGSKGAKEATEMVEKLPLDTTLDCSLLEDIELTDLLELMDKQEKRVLYLFLGLNGGRRMKKTEVAKELHMSIPTVRKLCKAGLDKIKEHLEKD